MADRSVSVRLSADVGQFTQAMGQAARSAEGLASSLPQGKGGFLDNVNRHSGELNQLAGTMATVGAVGVASFGAVAKAAIDWESQFAGVMKTVDDTSAGYAALSDELRGMARELPASHQEIAATAEAAGQLGVAREDIASFSRVMIDLGETTNLTATEAATSLARFSEIMGTSTSEVDRLGSTLVGLGNNFATTESEILAMSMRLAGMGNQVGMSEADVMGLSAAMSSVGIEAEAGGTAMSLSMRRINNAVADGGEKLEGFAQVAGMTADEFTTAWQASPSQALTAFVEGLARINAEGGNVSATLSDLGMTGVRETDALLRLAGAGDLLGRSFAMAGDEFQRNTALTEEAQQRYDTAAARIQVAWNQIKDAAISAGAAIGPAIATMAEGVASLATWVSDLPPGLLTTTALVVGIGGAALVAGAGFIRLTTGIASTTASLTALAAASPRAAAGLGLVSAAAGPLMWGALAFAGLGVLQNSLLEIPGSAEDAAAALEEFGDSAGQVSSRMDDLFTIDDDFSIELNGLNDAIEALTYQESAIARFGSSFANVFGIKDELAVTREQFALLDSQLAAMEPEAAAAAYAALEQKMLAAGISAETIADTFTEYQRSVADAIPVLDGLGAASSAAAGEVHLTEAAAEEAAAAMDELTSSINDAADAFSSFVTGQLDILDAIAQTNEVIKENGRVTNEQGTAFDRSTQAGRDSERALYDLAAQTRATATEQAELGHSTGEVALTMLQGRAAFIDAATAAGLTEEAAHSLADQLFAVPDVHVDFTKAGDLAVAGAAVAVGAAVGAVPDVKTTQFRAEGVQAAVNAATSVANAIRAIPSNKTTTITTVMRGSVSASTGMQGVGTLRRATGGPIPGWSPHPKADNIPLWATAGEFMQPVAAVDYYGPRVMEAIRTRSIPRDFFGAMGLANGGHVGASRLTPVSHWAPPTQAPNVTVTVPRDHLRVEVGLIENRLSHLIEARVRQMQREGKVPA